MGFFKSFFSGKSDSPANEKQKNEQKNFEIFKYDGMRAQRMGRTDYASNASLKPLPFRKTSRPWDISPKSTPRPANWTRRTNYWNA